MCCARAEATSAAPKLVMCSKWGGHIETRDGARGDPEKIGTHRTTMGRLLKCMQHGSEKMRGHARRETCWGRGACLGERHWRGYARGNSLQRTMHPAWHAYPTAHPFLGEGVINWVNLADDRWQVSNSDIPIRPGPMWEVKLGVENERIVISNEK